MIGSFLISVLAVLIGTVLLTTSNVFINGSSLKSLLRFNIPAIMTGNLIIVLVLLALTYRWIGAGAEPEDAFARLTKLPDKMLAGILALSLVLSLLYHTAERIFAAGASVPMTREYWLSLAASLLTEMTVALIIGMLIYALCRRIVRPYVVKLGVLRVATLQRGTLVKPLTAASLSCFFIVASAGVDYVMVQGDNDPQLWPLAAVVGCRVIFGWAVFSLLIFEIRRDIRSVLSQLGGLLADGGAARQPIPVAAADELGELAEAFNALQARMSKASDELRRELRLAYQVQNRLLPERAGTYCGLEAAAVSLPSREVGGDLYDITDLGGGRLAVMIGDVSGNGMPAAMLMAATLTLYRKTIREQRSPAEALRQLNGLFAETMQGRGFITMGIGFWYQDSGMLRYASAGHLSPFLLRGGRVEEMDIPGAFPLGIDSETTYSEHAIPLQPADALLLCTDGIVEAHHAEGGMLGFDGLAAELGRLNAGDGAAGMLRKLQAVLPASVQAAADDDRTMVLLVRPRESAVAGAGTAGGADALAAAGAGGGSN